MWEIKLAKMQSGLMANMTAIDEDFQCWASRQTAIGPFLGGFTFGAPWLVHWANTASWHLLTSRPGALTGLPAPYANFFTQNWIEDSGTHCHKLLLPSLTIHWAWSFFFYHNFLIKHAWNMFEFSKWETGMRLLNYHQHGCEKTFCWMALSLQPLHDDLLRQFQ